MVSDDRCGPFSSRNANSGCESETDVVAVNSWGTPGEERHNNSGSHELVVTSDKLHEESKCIDSGHGTKEHGKFLLLLHCTQFVLDEGEITSVYQEF